MSAAVAYLDRTSGGVALQAVRFVHARGEATWTAGQASGQSGGAVPGGAGAGSGAGGAGAGGAASEGARGGGVLTAEAVRRGASEAAEWIAARLRELPAGTELLLCLDTDGARCAWMNTPAGDDKALADAISAARAEGAADDGTHSARSMHWLEGAEPGADTTAQALGGAVAVAAPARTRPFARRPEAPRPRLAVLAAPDLLARLVLDELDARGVEVRQVLSIWHAVALAWEQDGAEAAARDAAAAKQRPARPETGAPGPGAQAGAGVVVGAGEDAPVWASVLIDPSGRLVWSWSRRGGLLAAGSMRLRRTVVDPEAPPEGGPPADLAPLAGGDGTEPGRAGARARAPEVAIVEVARSDAGRLIAEWLGWSLELTAVPSRLRVIGPPALTCAGFNEDLPGVPAAAALAHHLTAAWPGAVGEPALREDPLLETLRSLVQAHNDLSGAVAAPTPALSLAALSSRPGRATRRAYIWQGVVAVLVGVLVAGLGLRLRAAAGDQDALREAVVEQRGATIRSVLPLVPGLRPDHPDPSAVMRQRLTVLKNEQVSAPPEDAVLAELVRVLSAAMVAPSGSGGSGGGGGGGAGANPQLSRVAIESRGGFGGGLQQVSCQFTDPTVAAEFERRLREQPVPTGRAYIEWSSRMTPGVAGGPRSLILTGRWTDPQSSRAGGAAGKGPGGGGSPR